MTGNEEIARRLRPARSPDADRDDDGEVRQPHCNHDRLSDVRQRRLNQRKKRHRAHAASPVFAFSEISRASSRTRSMSDWLSVWVSNVSAYATGSTTIGRRPIP